MITIVNNIIVTGEHQKPIVTDVMYQQNDEQKPVVIFCHGYKGFKDWGAWDLVGKAFAEAGFFFIKFNFSHNGGTLEQPVDFPDLEAFGQNNYIKELDDLDSILNWVYSTEFAYSNQINLHQITLIGHSRGGGIVTIKASEDSRITKLITWASVSDYKKRFPVGEVFDQWKKNGVYYIINGRTKQQMPHYFQFYTTFIENEERLTIASASKKIQVPQLIVHGIDDPTVDVQEAKKLHLWNPNSELFLIKGADHVFGAKHPWDHKELPKDLEIIVKKTMEFTLL
ncbi:alpha/beta hydrolase family protein [Aquimarina sp. 2201CG5-10]|uniref:alpha/beta hydrolase family protein n=1 Tax=Aquimarina callyspongiae TaxID=3098150 RepID=UPI002AB485B6|nr:alpha/beta fold hydrolase [Aquimarina sp. 2201CG5-10]MDY8135126.1 alpha/beta fold hydrolase [Aquimarina sp. 2201CG5-10]